MRPDTEQAAEQRRLHEKEIEMDKARRARPDERVTPDDITDEEAASARAETTAQGLTAEQVDWRVRKICAAQNRLRDGRVRQDERERIARMADEYMAPKRCTDYEQGYAAAMDDLARAIRGGDEHGE